MIMAIENDKNYQKKSVRKDCLLASVLIDLNNKYCIEP